MAPQTQSTLVIPKFKAPWELKTNQPVPAAGKGQLLVKNEAVALNPVDWKIQKLGWFITEDKDYPALIGTDIAGVVEELGEGVTGFAKGDRVVFQGSWSAGHGGYQQYTVTEAVTTAKIPDGVSFDAAATIPVALAVSVVGFYQSKTGVFKGADLGEPFADINAKQYAGKTVVILGGSSSVGQFAIQLARLSGFTNIITTSSVKHTEFLKTLGVTHVIDRSTPTAKIIEEVKKIGGSLPNFVYDSISSQETQQLAHDLTAVGGTTIVVLPPAIEAAEGKELYHALGLFSLSPENQALGNRLYSVLTKLIAEKHIQPNRPEVIPNGLAGVAKGLERLEKGLVSGNKLVIHPQETS